MPAVPAALVKAFGQLADRAVLALAAKSIAVRLIVFGAFGIGLYFAPAEASKRFGVNAGWAGVAAAVRGPCAGLIAPAIGAAAGTHLVLRRIDQGRRRAVIKPLAALATAALVLSGCASGPKPALAPAPVRAGAARGPQVMAPQGREGVIGMGAAALTRRFGSPRIDLAEGDTRKLQFAGQTCVLDIYLYPPRIGVDPNAAHVAARLRQGGAAIDAGACLREVERR